MPVPYESQFFEWKGVIIDRKDLRNYSPNECDEAAAKTLGFQSANQWREELERKQRMELREKSVVQTTTALARIIELTEEQNRKLARIVELLEHQSKRQNQKSKTRVTKRRR